MEMILVSKLVNCSIYHKVVAVTLGLLIQLHCVECVVE